jgi:hypothetical protein
MICGFTRFTKIVFVILIFTGISYAEVNPRKISMEPWVYQAMGFLQDKGFITDYPSGWVNSGNQLSRFEIAYYIKGFIVNKPASKKLPDSAVEVLQKLIAEFQMELTDLGIQITDINKVSPNLVKFVPQVSEYQDLDVIISKTKGVVKQPCYYLGQYFSELQKKAFVFIPLEYFHSNYSFFINDDDSNLNVVYQPQLSNAPSFLVIKSYLPISSKKSLAGYYLFPIKEFKSGPSIVDNSYKMNLNDTVLALLDEVNQIQWLDSLWSVNGVLPLNGYLPRKADLKTRSLVGNLNQGLKIGGLLVYTENPSNKTSSEVNDYGLPFYNSSVINSSANTKSFTSMPIDLDVINSASLQSAQFNIQGAMQLTPQTSLYGGIDLLYQDTNTGLDNIWTTNTKASAELNYHLNDYWTVLTYQSFVNSQQQTGWLSTTSLGIDYNDWVTLWLAYQLVNFDNPIVSGSLALRF